MTFGLRNAAQTFQRFIDEALRDLPFCYGYIDDILIFSQSHEQHLQHLRALFHRLHEYGILINPAKCEFGKDIIVFLGHEVSSAGLRPLDEKVQAIRDFPIPEDIKQLRRFLGMFNFYRRFIPNAASLQAPLNVALSGPKKKGTQKIEMTPEMLDSFNACKSGLQSTVMLAHPHANAELALHTDASNTAIGAVLQQKIGPSRWEPLAFFSRRLKTAQTKYSTFDRELLAIYEAIRYFRHMLEARLFVIFTDHKPLIHAFSTKQDSYSPRQFRYLDFISQFSTDIRYVKGEDNVVADALSRVQELAEIFSYTALGQAQKSDPELQDLIKNGSSLNLSKWRRADEEPWIYCDISQGLTRPYITKAFRYDVFKTLHGLSHPGARATTKLVTQRYVWPGVKADCRKWTKECTDCQRSKVTRHISSPTSPFSSPTHRFSHVHMDIVGPLPISSDFRYILTVIDRYTRWPEAYPMVDITAEGCAQAFIAGWVARFGCPERITTDRGRQFECELFSSISKILGAEHRPTTAYHPACNGMVERLHRQLKAAIMCHCSDSWSEVLPLVLLGIRSACKEDIGASAAELVYGEPLRLPGEFLVPSKNSTMDHSAFVTRLREHMAKLSPEPASWHTNKVFFVPKDLASSKFVFLRLGPAKKSLQPPYTGPYKVLERGEKTFKIEVQGKEQRVTIDRLKPAHLTREPDNNRLKTSPIPPATLPTPSKPENQERKTRSGRTVRFPAYYRP